MFQSKVEILAGENVFLDLFFLVNFFFGQFRVALGSSNLPVVGPFRLIA